LFEDNVDFDVEDSTVDNKGKLVHVEETTDDDFIVHDDLDMPDSDDEQEI
jgi:hypothetical protein